MSERAAFCGVGEEKKRITESYGNDVDSDREEKTMVQKEIEICEFPAADYMPLVDYEGWRVAVLAYCENTRAENIHTMQKHEETDEVFVLLRGKVTLLTAGSGETPGEVVLHEMEPMKTYNVKKGVWHNHILDEEGVVLIVENRNTCDENSPVVELAGNVCSLLFDRIC